MPPSFSSSSPPPPASPDATSAGGAVEVLGERLGEGATPGRIARADERGWGGAVGGVGGALEVSRAAVRAVVLAPRGVVPLHAHPLAILAHDGSDVAHGGAGAVPRLDAATHLCIVWHHHHDVDADARGRSSGARRGSGQRPPVGHPSGMLCWCPWPDRKFETTGCWARARVTVTAFLVGTPPSLRNSDERRGGVSTPFRGRDGDGGAW